jgi:hypothetical protein
VSGLENANADGAISWANLLIDYGPWLAHLPAGEIGSTPPYNTAFERSFALHALELSEDAFAAGYDLEALLRDGGHRVLFQPAARIDHVNVSSASPWLGQRYTAARARAGLRSRDWPRSRRLGYALAAPLIPAILAARLAKPLLAAERARELPRLTAPAMLLGLAAAACGELTAFITGERPEIVRRADEFELNKVRYSGMRP